MVKEKNELLIIIAHQKCVFIFEEEMSNWISIICFIDVDTFIRKVENVRKWINRIIIWK